ncbi:MAG: phosphotriesterase-related protein [Firmicutes bacterium]|nr:phosphotriesterase-related protein [Bacillota bacterium]
MARVLTIQGEVDPKDLGVTYTHEHLICFPPPVVMREDADFELPRVDKAVEELALFYQAGGRCLVEGTAIDYGRDVKALIEISRQTPVHIVFTTGFNKGRFYPDWVIQASVDELRDLMIREIEEGAEGTGARPGVLKCGSWYNVITPQEEKVTRAVARAHKATGAPIWVHTEAGTMALEQLDILEQEGADLSKVTIGHCDRNADLWLHRKIAARGAFVGYDGPSKVKYYPDSVRVELIKGMLEAGYGKQLLISGDMGRRSYLTAYGGGPGFRYILEKFIPRLRDEGLTQEEIDQIWIHNPARWLAF